MTQALHFPALRIWVSWALPTAVADVACTVCSAVDEAACTAYTAVDEATCTMHSAADEAEPAHPFLSQSTLCLGFLSCCVMPFSSSRAPLSHLT